MSTVRYFKLFEMQQLKLNSTGTGRNRRKCKNGRGPNRAKYHTFVTGIADPHLLTCPSHHLSHICGHDPITSRQLICIKYTKIPYPLICPFNISDLKFFIHPLSILSLIYPAPAPAQSTLTARPRPRLKISCI